MYDVVPSVVSKMREGMCFIDIGANAGLFCVMAAKRVGDEGIVFAFEPDFEQYVYLVRNIAANDCRNVVPLPFAVAERTGSLPFSAQDKGQSGKHSISTENHRADDTRVYGLHLSTDFPALEKLVAGRETVIKIDVEGFEYKVLLSIVSLLQLETTTKLVVEIDDKLLRRYGSCGEQIRNLLHEFGFKCRTWIEKPAHFDAVFTRDP